MKYDVVLTTFGVCYHLRSASPRLIILLIDHGARMARLREGNEGESKGQEEGR